MHRRIFLVLTLCSYFVSAWGASEPAVLVTGGAGYIGTQTCKALKEAGFFPVIYDNLSRGHREAVKWGVLIEGDISDRKKLIQTIEKYHPVALLHFAGFKSVGESVKDPAKYYRNNLCGLVILLDVMREKGMKKIIFSSTAATYGQPETSLPLKETDPCAPINPYGRSKWMGEQIIGDFERAYGMKYISLRYFNVAGADLEMECGERGENPINLIPIIAQVAAEKRKDVSLFGRDYLTRDGTAIRDYLHVVDLADAHVRALQYLLQGKPSVVLNLGTGHGASVQEVIDMVRTVSNRPISVIELPRRVGDPPFLTADASLAQKLLGWKPKHSDLKVIVETEWNWISRLD